MHALTSTETVFRKITPASLGLNGLRYATAWHAGQLLVSLQQHDSARQKEIRRVMTWEPGAGRWETLYSKTLRSRSIKRTENPGELWLPETFPPVTRILQAPVPGGAETVRFLFQSSLGSQSLSLAQTPNGKLSVETAQDAPSGERWLSWLHHQRFLFAVREGPGGGRQLAYIKGRGAKAGWEDAGSPDPSSHFVAIVAFYDRLIVALDNARRGFSLWRLEHARGKISWTPVLIEGAERFLLNANVQQIAVWRGALYVAAGVSSPELSRKYRANYPGCGLDLIRVYEDDDWDVLIGAPRFTPKGLKVPLSGLAEGSERWLSPDFRCLVAGSSGCFLGTEGDLGPEAWSSSDGEQWRALGMETFSSYENVSFSAAYDTAHGPLLVVETTDYGKNRLLEIWLGALAHI